MMQIYGFFLKNNRNEIRSNEIHISREPSVLFTVVVYAVAPIVAYTW